MLVLEKRMTDVPQILIDIRMQKWNSIGLFHKHLERRFGIIIIKLNSDPNQFIFIGLFAARDDKSLHLTMISAIEVNVIFQLHQAQLFVGQSFFSKWLDIFVNVAYRFSCHFWIILLLLLSKSIHCLKKY